MGEVAACRGEGYECGALVVCNSDTGILSLNWIEANTFLKQLLRVVSFQ